MQTFNLLFDSKNAQNISKGILAMTASTHTTIDFVQKIMKLAVMFFQRKVVTAIKYPLFIKY